MTYHLPDCDDFAFSGAGFCKSCERICICRQVRRVEHRVNKDRRQDVADARYDGYGEGFADGVQAAREALAGWFVANRDEMTWPDALATINALRDA